MKQLLALAFLIFYVPALHAGPWYMPKKATIKPSLLKYPVKVVIPTFPVSESTPRLIETIEDSADFAKIEVDNSGNAFVVWGHRGGAAESFQNKYWISRYTSGGGWASAESLIFANAHYLTSYDFALDGIGNLFLVWDSIEGYTDHPLPEEPPLPILKIRSMRRPLTSLDPSDSTILFDTLGFHSPHVHAWDDGRALVVLGPSAKGYSMEGVWGLTHLIEGETSPKSNLESDVDVAFDGAGNALEVWLTVVSSTAPVGTPTSKLYSSRYTPAGWGDLNLIRTILSPNWPSRLQVSGNASGNAFAIWLERSGGNESRIWAKAYRTDSGWETGEHQLASEITPGDSTTLYAPNIAVDPSGNALAIWAEKDGRKHAVWAKFYRVDSGWGTPLQIFETEQSGPLGFSNVSFDASGNAIVALFEYEEGVAGVRITRCRADSGGCESPYRIMSREGPIGFIDMAMDGNGNTFLLWRQKDPSTDKYDLWASRIPKPLPSVNTGTRALE